MYPVALHSILNRVNSIYSIFFLAYQDEQLRGRKKKLSVAEILASISV